MSRDTGARQAARRLAAALSLAVVTACGSTAVPGGTGAVAPAAPGSEVGVADPMAVDDGLGLPGESGTTDSAPADTVAMDGSATTPVGSTTSSAPGSSAPQGSTPGTTTTDPGAPGTSRGAGGGSAAPPPTALPQGVTDKEIKIGVIGVNQASTAAVGNTFGADVPNPGDPKRQTEAIVKYINDNGGIAGRTVVPIVVERETSSTDPNQLEKICAAMTQDHKVYAVITNYSDDTHACYAKRRTLLLDDNGMSERVVLNPLNPWVWGPGLPTTEGTMRALIDSLAAQDYFGGEDVKLGLISHDEPANHALVNDVIVPRLAKLRQNVDVSVFIKGPESTQDQASWAQAIQNAQLKFQTEGVTHVMFNAGGGGVPIIFMNQAERQLYRPRYAVSSTDSPGLLLENSVPPEQLRGAVGAGYNLITDVNAQNAPPYPTGEAEKRCVEALRSQGDPPPSNRTVAFAAEYICDGFFMLQAAFPQRTEDLSIGAWTTAVEALGTSYQATYSLPGGTEFGPGIRAGGQYYRWLQFVNQCKCFRYASDNKRIPQ